MFKFLKLKSYPLNKFNFFKTISPFYFKDRLFFAGERKEKSKTCIYKYDYKKKKLICCLIPNKDQRFISPHIFKYKKNYLMLFELQNRKTKLSQISLAKSRDLNNWKVVNLKFIYNKNYSIGSPAIIKDKAKNKFAFFFYKQKKNEIRHICFFKKNLNLNINNYKENSYMYNNILFNDYAPFIFKIENEYFNIFSRWYGFITKKGFIFFSKSKDLIHWSTPIKVKVSEKIYLNKPKIIHYSEPHVTLNNNKLYLYFEQCNENGRWTIVKTKLLQ